jgi:hypothetical protein
VISCQVSADTIARPTPPTSSAAISFADLWIRLRRVLVKVFLFTLRLSFSGQAVHRAFATQGQEAFLEGHVYAFRLGGGAHRQDPLVSIRWS